jgi:hypothetical protein
MFFFCEVGIVAKVQVLGWMNLNIKQHTAIKV